MLEATAPIENSEDRRFVNLGRLDVEAVEPCDQLTGPARRGAVASGLDEGAGDGAGMPVWPDDGVVAALLIGGRSSSSSAIASTGFACAALVGGTVPGSE